MSQIRFTMKFRDGQIAWSERHWFYPGAPVITSPSIYPQSPNATLSAALTAAQTLAPLRVSALCAGIQYLGGVLSFDDTARDGAVVGNSGYPQYAVPVGTAIDPELSVLTRMGSVPPGSPVGYNANFYVAGFPTSVALDQAVNANDPWYVPYYNYVKGLLPQGTTPNYFWGWKAVLKNPPGITPVLTAVFSTTTFVPTLTVTLAAAMQQQPESQVINLTGFKQQPGARPRLNGRWIVQGGWGTTTMVLTRKNFPTYASTTSIGLLSTGFIVPTVYVIVPYTSRTNSLLVKRDRGGSLGLPRGRSRGRPANV